MDEEEEDGGAEIIPFPTPKKPVRDFFRSMLEILR